MASFVNVVGEKKMLYRIFIEDFDRPTIVKLISRYFNGFTLLEGVGFYQGVQASSVVIEIDSNCQEYNARARIDSLIKELKLKGNQAGVLLQIVPISSYFL